MKKKFLEPEIVRIDIKMTENIAISGGTSGEVVNDYAYGSSGLPIVLIARIGTTMCYEKLISTNLKPSHNPNVEGFGFVADTNEIVTAIMAGCIRDL